MANLKLLRVGSVHCLFGAGGWAWAYRLWVSRANAAAFSLAARRSAYLRVAAAVRFATRFLACIARSVACCRCSRMAPANDGALEPHWW